MNSRLKSFALPCLFLLVAAFATTHASTETQKPHNKPCNATPEAPGTSPAALKFDHKDASNTFYTAPPILMYTPEGNPTECKIRQRYIVVPISANALSPDIVLQAFKHGGAPLSTPVQYDIVAFPSGGNLEYRINIISLKKMKGDYDLVITVSIPNSETQKQ